MKIFFATDIHGSEVCWRKFLNSAAFYKADMVILGGDVTGKVMVPIVKHAGYWEVSHNGGAARLETHQEVAEVEREIRKRGWYPVVVSPEELSELSTTEEAVDRRFTTEMLRTLDRWLDMADERLRGGEIPCIVNGGNDDTLAIDSVIDASPCVSFAEGRVIDLGGFYLVSMGWTNPTPWDTYREASEEELARKIAETVDNVPDMGRAIFNFHAPPYGTGLDEAPALDETLKPKKGGTLVQAVGSKAVRDAILRCQPMLSVHGHIHESKGIVHLGRTLCLNPGSVYSDGVLQGAVLELNAKKSKVSQSMLITG
jgi:uncharacterized protein